MHKKLQVVQQDSKRENFRANILFSPDDLFPCRFARSALEEHSTITALYHHSKGEACPYSAAINTAPGHLWSLGSTEEMKGSSTAMLTS